VNSKVTILTEAGRKYGFGHYTRCSSIFHELKKSGTQCELLVNTNDLKLNDTGIISFNWIDQIHLIKRQSTNDVVIVDSYIANDEIFHKLKKIFAIAIAIDDYNRISYFADWILNPNAFFNADNYSNQTALCLGGKDYIILRNEFRELVHINNLNPIVQNILITIGGSDFRNLLPKLIEISIQSGKNKINVIAPESSNITFPNDKVSIFPAQNAKGIIDLMQQADVVISACGQTLYELISLGKPTIGICLDIDQKPNQDYCLKSGFLKSEIAWDDSDLENKILKEINYYEIIENRLLIEKLAPSLINKNGVYNITKWINELINDTSK
jgi:spore coat polysaccharide biosynthesis predicted glycosyltransferase SpsG